MMTTFKQLSEALHSDDKDIRGSAAEALGNLGDVRAVEPLAIALRDSHKYVRRRAAEALGKLGEPALEPLVSALEETDDYTRRRILEALGMTGSPRAVQPLTLALNDSNHYIRLVAATALGNIHDAGAVTALINALRDPALQRNVSQALGRLGKLALYPLVHTLHDPDRNLRFAAASALLNIHMPEAMDALASVDYWGEIPP
jgi:HEAT repeat protein